ncbi:hypothetical protein POVWA2_046460 [Plasmodium ovale wallikeri]|uniref:Uncharacterized protein n=1 Tax=Plasmodium ovale wallikeri TaxID=864142 RepID=A0A1A8ZGU8_PLAOA|nr:hypothetical protein POVWA1_047520 [Plasmodium ovale wallikeri]SBT43764.1 hypothetical protein POVWA2_046460 [Plasmodium ovale wallikeri]
MCIMCHLVIHPPYGNEHPSISTLCVAVGLQIGKTAVLYQYCGFAGSTLLRACASIHTCICIPSPRQVLNFYLI